MMKRVIPTVAVMAGVLMMAAPANAGILLDYADILIDFDHATGKLTVVDHAGTSLKATLRDNADVVLDRADIASAASFDVLFDALVSNPAGADNIGISGTLAGTDTDLGSDAYKGSLGNLAGGLGGADGIAFVGGILSITTKLSGIGGSILLDPVAGDWIFSGTSDFPTGVGSDGLSDQFTVADAQRDNFTTGKVIVIDIAVPVFGDGSSTFSFGNADDFFAAALTRDGFMSDGGDMKVTIVPAPGAALLAVMGMGMVGWIKRRS